MWLLQILLLLLLVLDVLVALLIALVRLIHLIVVALFVRLVTRVVIILRNVVLVVRRVVLLLPGRASILSCLLNDTWLIINGSLAGYSRVAHIFVRLWVIDILARHISALITLRRSSVSQRLRIFALRIVAIRLLLLAARLLISIEDSLDILTGLIVAQ